MSRSSTSMPQVGVTLAENDSGRLEKTAGSDYKGSFTGYRTLLVDGRPRVESRRFFGAKDEVLQRWLAWQKKAHHQSNKHEGQKEESMTQTKSAPVAKAMPKKVYVVRFSFGKQVKEPFAFVDGDKALDMVVGLNEALKIAEGDGEWSVEEVELR